MIRIFTDGACRGNPGPGGWGVLIYNCDELVELSGHEPRTTNNRMEMQAVIEALQRVPADAEVEVISDSQYVIKGMTEWMPGWKRRGWINSQGRPVENRDLWEVLERLAGRRVRWRHVYGHMGHLENERANDLAQAASRKEAPPVKSARAVVPTALGRPEGVSYLSLVDGCLERWHNWPECQSRVAGVSGARYKRCRNLEEELATLSGWGLPADALAALNL